MSEAAAKLEQKKETAPVEVRKIRVLASAEQKDMLCGQSKILNWAYNALLSRLKTEYGRFIDIGRYLDISGSFPDESYELEYEDLFVRERLNSRYWIRDLVPGLKDEHPFLRLVHSSPMKNAALRLTETFKQWRKRRGEGYGFPKFRSWSKDFFSLEYDEMKGWNARGTDLHLVFGQRVVPENELTPKQAKALARKRKSDPNAVLKEQLGLDLVLAEKAPPGAYRIEIVREGGDFFCVFTHKVRVIPRIKQVGTRVYLDPNHKNFFYGLSPDGKAFEVANRAGLKVQNIRIDHLKSKRDRAVRRCELVQYTRDDGSVHRHWNPSNAWFRRNRALLREEAKRRDQNKTFVRTALHRLFDSYDAVGLGNYTPEAKDHKLGSKAKSRKKANRSINNNSLLGSLQRLLPQVASNRGKVSYVLDERGTTRTCHACSHVIDGGIRPDIRAWVCPGCGDRHIRDENACQNGLRRLDAVLSADGLLGNPICDAHATENDRSSDATLKSGVAVTSRCNWTFDQQWSCGIVEMPRDVVANLFASAKEPTARNDKVQKEPGEFSASPAISPSAMMTPIGNPIPIGRF